MQPVARSARTVTAEISDLLPGDRRGRMGRVSYATPDLVGGCTNSRVSCCRGWRPEVTQVEKIGQDGRKLIVDSSHDEVGWLRLCSV